MKKIRKWICKKFGHNFNTGKTAVLMVMASIERKNPGLGDAKVPCARCGKEIHISDIEV